MRRFSFASAARAVALLVVAGVFAGVLAMAAPGAVPEATSSNAWLEGGAAIYDGLTPAPGQVTAGFVKGDESYGESTVTSTVAFTLPKGVTVSNVELLDNECAEPSAITAKGNEVKFQIACDIEQGFSWRADVSSRLPEGSYDVAAQFKVDSSKRVKSETNMWQVKMPGVFVVPFEVGCTAGSEDFSGFAEGAQPTRFAGGTLDVSYGSNGGIYVIPAGETKTWPEGTHLLDSGGGVTSLTLNFTNPVGTVQLDGQAHQYPSTMTLSAYSATNELLDMDEFTTTSGSSPNAFMVSSPGIDIKYATLSVTGSGGFWFTNLDWACSAAEPPGTVYAPEFLFFQPLRIAAGTTDWEPVLFENDTGSTVYLDSAGVSSAEFAIQTDGTGACMKGVGVDNGDSCVIEVGFRPTEPGPVTGSLTTSWVDSGGTTVATTETLLRGTGLADVITTPTTGLDFGSVDAGTTSTRGITFTNEYASALYLLAVSRDGSSAFAYDPAGSTCDDGAIDPETTCTISVTFSPPSGITESTVYDASLVIEWGIPPIISGEEDDILIAMTETPLTGTGEPATAGQGLSINNPSIYYGGSIIFTVTMSHTSTTPVTFDWATADGTAVSGTTCNGTNDYVGGSGSKTITAGSTSTTISVATCSDGPGNRGGNQTNFTVTISNPSGATITGTGIGTGTLNRT